MTCGMAAPLKQDGDHFAPLPDRTHHVTVQRCWSPHRIGPRFDWLDHNRIMVVDGPLSERQFDITTDIRKESAVVRLRERGSFAGQVLIDRDPPGRGIILSSAAVGQRLRRGGLAAIMTWCAFRELLVTQASATFRIRMARPTRPCPTGTEDGDIAMGIIAARLGFRPELPLEDIIHEGNLTGITAMPGDSASPPALKIMLRSYPSLLVAFALSPDTMKPTSDYQPYLQIKEDDNLIRALLHQGLLLVKGSYRLGDSGIERFVNAVATDEEEAIQFRSKIRPL